MRVWIGILAICMVGVVGLAGYAAWTLRELPAPGHEAGIVKAVSIYDRDGRLIGERSLTGEFHIYEKLDQIGKLPAAATLAAEDRDFYRHGPIDPPSLARASLADLTRGSAVQGGSTITQQLVKIQVLGPEKSISRKLQEAFLAWAMERRYTKDQILEMYLNRAYYGHGAYGLASATKTYFGKQKEPRDLTPAQAAFLAALLQAPNQLDPKTNFEGVRARQLHVLKLMADMHAINRAEADRAGQDDIRSQLRYDVTYRQTVAPHFVDWVLQRVEQDLGPTEAQKRGLAIRTTLDSRLQALAEQAVAAGVVDLARYGVNNGALLAVRPATGEILAWVGSAGYGNNDIGGQFDVVRSSRQPGSSFKPYVYEAALRDRKITLCTTVHDVPQSFGGYQPVDFDNRFMGSMSARRALLLSRNVPAVEVGAKEGMGNINRLAAGMGIRSRLEDNLATAIGGSGVTMFDHVQAYAVFANQGQKMPLTGVTRVVDGGGNTLFEQPAGHQGGTAHVMSSGEAYLITDVLKDYQRQWSLGWNRQMASKSGTSGGRQTGVHPDAWMMAYNPDVVVGAWAGNSGPDGAGKPTSAFGVNVGATISARFVNGLPPQFSRWYGPPEGLVRGRSGELFLPGTEKDPCASVPASPPQRGPQVPPRGHDDEGKDDD